MPNVRDLFLNRPTVFTPSVVRGLRNTGGTLQQTTLAMLEGATVGNTSSFRYDPVGVGLKSTQQLNVDWSKFQNHVFFNSAQVKVNTTFQRIFDTFPFDGTKEECELFFDKLTGYERYVFDSLLPKNKGYLFLSGTRGTETAQGTFVTTKDVVGAEYPTLVRTATGRSTLNPGLSSMTLEFQLFIPPVSSSNQVIVQKVSSSAGVNDQGFGIVLNSTGSLTSCDIKMIVTSGSYVLSTSAVNINKNQFNHVAFVWDRAPGVSRIFGFANQSLVASSSAQEIGNLSFDGASFLIGSGSAMGGFVPANTLSGAMDELRVWHSVRTSANRNEFSTKNVFALPDLKLYYKFNEISGSGTSVVLDHSGNGLHGTLCSYAANTLRVREVASGSVAGPSPMINEKNELTPVLFDGVNSIAVLTGSLLASAKVYDEANPNWIVNLVPPHFLSQGQYQDALATTDGAIVDGLVHGNEAIRRTSLGDTQVLLLLLYTWAKFFDELKLYLDAFGNLHTVGYETNDTAPDQFLNVIANRYGLELPSLFANSSINQFINGDNLDTGFGTGSLSLQKIQTQIWRRILVNIKDVLNSKGTVHSVKALIRATGIDPDNNFRIREFGGPTKRSLKSSREQRSEASALLSFVSGGHISSSFLTSPRVEPGYPWVTSTANDTLLTSGSWTVETMVKFEKPSPSTQSVIRMGTKGIVDEFLTANLLAIKGVGFTAYLCPSKAPSAPILSMSIGTFDPMDGQVWNVSFGRQRDDSLGQLSSSYFLRAAKQSFGKITEEHTTSSWFEDKNPIWSFLDPAFNDLGSFIAVGSQSIQPTTIFLNSATVPEVTRTTNFNGKIGQLRFWSKDLSVNEWREHTRNFKSLGIQNPKDNFNFVKNTSGSFERLRLDVHMDQPLTRSLSNGKFVAFDFSQNNLHMSGNSFPATSSVVVPETFYYSFLSPHFDDGSTTNKVRVRSFQNFDNVLNDENHYAGVAPVYGIDKSEEPQDNTRFSIDLSVVDALNQDIISMFSSLDEFDNTLGNPELLFSPDYPSLEHLRNVYFNRLTDKIQLKIFFEFYKWFDKNLGEMIFQLLPRKTKFLGTNYCIESHMLERPKFEYQFSDIYLGDDLRHGPKDSITIQLFTGNITKI